MTPLPLSLLCALPGFRHSTLSGPASVSIEAAEEGTGVLRTDSRLCRPGDLFVALVGNRTDAQELVPELLKRGVLCVVTRAWHLAQSRELREAPGQVVVEDTRDWLPRAVCRLCGLDQAPLKTWGITGTNGKTSTAWMLQQLLGGLDPLTALVGTLGARIGTGELRDTGMTTPDALWLGRFARELVQGGTEHLVMEVSSHAIEQQREAVLSFSGAIFLNLSPEHLDYHGDMETYYRVKASFMRRPECELRLVNTDSDWGQRMAEELSFMPLKTLGRGPGCDWRICGESMSPEGQTFLLEGEGVRQLFRIPLPGAYNVDNAAAALVMALTAGVSLDELVERAATLPPVPGRLEPVVLKGGPRVLIDYAHSPDGYEKVLAAVKPLVGAGRLHVLFGCGGERDRDKRPMMYHTASRHADQLWLCLDNPRGEGPEQIFSDMLSRGTSSTPQERIDDREAAIVRALSACRPEDTLLLLGKGHERYQLIGRQKLPFDEPKIIKRAWAWRPDV